MPHGGGNLRASTTPRCIMSTAKKQRATSSGNGISLTCARTATPPQNAHAGRQTEVVTAMTVRIGPVGQGLGRGRGVAEHKRHARKAADKAT